MATFDRLKVGQILYTVTSHKMGNTTMNTKAVHTMKVMEINAFKRTVFASWNGNLPRWHGERDVAAWRVKEPKLKKGALGRLY